MRQPRGRADRGDKAAEVILLFALGILAVTLVRTAWVCDDAYITLRSVRNFVEGNGLRWNLSERVQSFTHPLWFFTLAPIYAATREPYYSIIFLSLGLSVITGALLAFVIATSRAMGAVAIIYLVFSKAFTDYSTSGLENPLSHALLCVFFAVYLRPPGNPLRLFWLAFIASLGILNRMDALLIYLPALVHEARLVPPRRSIPHLAAGFSPFILWEMFSLLYFGFLFPNTAYAKLNTGISVTALAAQGAAYYLNSLRLDPITLFTIGAGAALPFVIKRRDLWPVSIGIVLHLAYIIKVGGDYMSGRFLSEPFLAAVIVIAQLRFERRPLVGAAAAACAILVGVASPATPLLSGADYGASKRGTIIDGSGIGDSRAFYYRRTGLLIAGRDRKMPDVAPGYLRPKRNAHGTIVHHNTGMLGFFGAEREDYILDDYALTDPLLARLPVRGKWRIGHFRRDIPPGYMETIGRGVNVIEDAELASYYDKLSLIVRGPLFSRERLRTIVNFNLGRYNHLRDAYANRDRRGRERR